jgi:hypothetical protein
MSTSNDGFCGVPAGGRSPGRDVLLLELRIKLLETQLAKAQAESDCLRETIRSKFVEKLDRVMYEGEG